MAKELEEIKAYSDERIEKAFTYHQPRESQVKRYTDIRAQGKYFAQLVSCYCPPSREASLALTKIEEAVMWANAAIARNE